MNWHTGQVEVYFCFYFFHLFSEHMLVVSHAVQYIFCAEHEPTVSDVYGRVIAAQSLSQDCMTSKLARGVPLILRLFNAPVTRTMHTASDLPVSNTLVPLPRMPSGV